MATRLYFHSDTDATYGTLPSGEQSSASATYTATGAATKFTLNVDIGTAQGYRGFNVPAFSSGDGYYGMFVSEALSGSQTVGGGSINFNTAEWQGLNFGGKVDGFNAYVWRPSTGTLVGTIKDFAGTSLGGSNPTTTGSEQVTHITGISSTGVSASIGDVIIVEVWSSSISNFSPTYGDSRFYFHGTTENTTENAVVSNHASFIEFAENLTFTPPASLGAITGTTSGTVVGRSTTNGAFSASGSAVPQVLGKSIGNAVASSVGTTGGVVNGSQPKDGVGASVGATGGSVAGVSAKVGQAVSAGTTSGTVVGKSNAASTGGSLGTVGGDIVGTGLRPITASASGVSTVTGVKGAGIGLGASDGLASSSIIGTAEARVIGSALGLATDGVVGRASKLAITTCVGVANLNGVGTGLSTAVGSSVGTSSLSIIGLGVQTGTAAANGVASLSGYGSSVVEGTVVSDGLSTADASGEALGLYISIGASDGLSSGNLVGASIGDGLAESGGYATSFAEMKQIGWSRPARTGSTWAQEAREI